MHRLIVVVSALALSFVPPLAAQERPVQPPGPVIETSGYGEARIAPDRASVTLSVETKGASAAATAATNARVQQRVLDTLAALGLRAPDVSTVGFNVSPNMEDTPRGGRQNGYVARNAVTVRLTDLARIGSVIDAALARGATGVADVEFTSTRRDSVSRIALASAAANARAEAEALASALGGRVVELMEASTEGEIGGSFTFSARRQAFARLSAMQISTPITPSDVVVGARVATRWRFVSNQPPR